MHMQAELLDGIQDGFFPKSPNSPLLPLQLSQKTTHCHPLPPNVLEREMGRQADMGAVFGMMQWFVRL